MTTLKEHIDGKVVFAYYKNKELWYLTQSGFKFPVPIEDCGDAMFMSVDKGIFFMRWIRKYMEEMKKEENL